MDLKSASRRIDTSTISGEIQHSLMASGGVLLLALALFVIKRSRAIGK
jgi:LPXTG-motif cell wall-anchored protein